MGKRNKNKSKTKVLIVITLVLVGIVVLAFTSILALAPVFKLKETKSSYTNLAVKDSTGNPCPYDESQLKQVKDLAYLESYDAMAKDDSIGLIINLQKNSIALQYKGVILNDHKISRSVVSGYFEALDVCSYKTLFSTPVDIANQWGTIEKHPIKIIKAPKDTIEALMQAKEKPDTTMLHAKVELIFTLKGGYKIYVRDENDKQTNSTLGGLTESMKQRWSDLKQILQFNMPSYNPTIIIYIKREDAISIYRGIPDKAQVILKI